MNQFSLHDQGAAFLTAGLVAKSDKIQGTRYTIDLWNEMRKKLSIKSRLDYLASILAYGQLLDRRLTKGDHFEYITNSLNNIRHELVIALTYPILGEKNGTKILADTYIVRPNDAASALLAAAYTSVSEKVESSKELIDIWNELRKIDLVNDNNEYLMALLASSRLNDLKQIIDSGGGIELILDSFRKLVLSIQPDLRVTKRDIAAAHLTIATVSQSIEIESNAQVLKTWELIKKEFAIEDDDFHIVTSILVSGLILNRTSKLNLEDIKYIYEGSKKRLLETLD
jgi:hypothetical protein